MEKSDWVPTKAEFHKGRWRASRDEAQVAFSSRMVADRQIAFYSKAIEQHARGTLVDLGCGQLPFFGVYGPKVEKCIGVDWPGSPHQSGNVDVFSDLNERIDLQDEMADTILCTDVLEHIFAPATLWSEIFRIARPGAIVIIGTPFMYRLHERPYDYHRYTNHALERYATKAGFETIDISPIGGLRHVIADLMSKSFRKRGLRSVLSPLIRAIAGDPYSGNKDTPYPLAYLQVARKPHPAPKAAISGDSIP